MHSNQHQKTTLYSFLGNSFKTSYATFGVAGLFSLARYEGLLIIAPLSILFFIKHKNENKNVDAKLNVEEKKEKDFEDFLKDDSKKSSQYSLKINNKSIKTDSDYEFEYRKFFIFGIKKGVEKDILNESLLNYDLEDLSKYLKIIKKYEN